MRFVASILIVLIGLLGCTKKTVVSQESGGTRLSQLEWKLGKLNEVTWKVGKTLRDIVTRNLTVVLETPKLAEDDEEYLRKTYGVDSWIVRVTHQNPSLGKIELGSLHVPFRGDSHGRGSGMPVKAVAFSLTYAAAAMSERFRGFNCPAFSHDKRLDDYEMTGEQTPIEMVVQAGPSFQEKLQKNELVPMTYNVGHSMLGTFEFEVALFNTVDSRLYSSYKILPFGLKVDTEETVKIDGCAGVHQEYEPAKDLRSLRPGYTPRVHK